LLALSHALDETSLVLLFGKPGLSRQIEDIKHDTHLRTKGELLRVWGGIEYFLAFLAASID
jgi:hypothetical protein